MVYSLHFRALRVAGAIFRCAQNAKVVRPSGSEQGVGDRVWGVGEVSLVLKRTNKTLK